MSSASPADWRLRPTLEGNITLHTMLYAFRAWILDGGGEVSFNKNVFAVGALQYLQKLYRESGHARAAQLGAGGQRASHAGG